jgi:hypothetical protein
MDLLAEMKMSVNLEHTPVLPTKYVTIVLVVLLVVVHSDLILPLEFVMKLMNVKEKLIFAVKMEHVPILLDLITAAVIRVIEEMGLNVRISTNVTREMSVEITQIARILMAVLYAAVLKECYHNVKND